jgi:plastocyanin
VVSVAAALAVIALLFVGRQAIRAASYDVDIIDYAFRPAQLTVQVGEPVTWTNKAGRAHTVTSDAETDLDSGNIGVGESYGHVFETAGTYRYHCSIHPDRMRGTIIVRAADPTSPGASEGPEPPAGTLPPDFSPFPTTGLIPTPTPTPTLVPSPTPRSTSGPTASPAPAGGTDPWSTAPVAAIAAGLVVFGGGIAFLLARRRP